MSKEGLGTGAEDRMPLHEAQNNKLPSITLLNFQKIRNFAETPLRAPTPTQVSYFETFLSERLTDALAEQIVRVCKLSPALTEKVRKYNEEVKAANVIIKRGVHWRDTETLRAIVSRVNEIVVS